LRIKNRNLQKQKEILEAKRQCVSAQAKVRQMIRDEEQRAQNLEQEIALMQREGEREMCPWAISKYFGDQVPTQMV
jgi:bacterioferritin (cytochrome b1)